MNLPELETRLSELGKKLPARDPAFSARVLAAIEKPARPRVTFGLQSWLLRSLLGLTVMLALVAAVWSFLMTAPQPAYALADVPKRMRTLNSLHMVGEVFPPDGSPAKPVEYFVRKPSDSRVNGNLTTVNGKLAGTSDIISTANERIILDHERHLATRQSQTREQASIEVSQELNSITQLLFGSWTNLKKLRTEETDGRSADVYQTSLASAARIVVWIAQQSGLPLRMEMYQTPEGQREQLVVRISTIEPDAALADSVFQGVIPADYKTIQAVPQTDAQAYGKVQFDQYHLLRRYAAELDNGDIVLCWALYDEKQPADDLRLTDADGRVKVKMATPVGDRFSEHLLHADASPEGYHWRWSLLRREGNFAGSMVSIDCSDGTSTGTEITLATPVSSEELQMMQRQTLPADQQPLTVEQIEKIPR